jgi:CheY-like chemotaxis protein
MLRLYLAQLGHQVYEAADGPSAVEAALRVLPDVALIDIGLPGIDGYEVARRIRATPDGRHLYLVAVTGYGQPKDREQASRRLRRLPRETSTATPGDPAGAARRTGEDDDMKTRVLVADDEERLRSGLVLC